MIVPATELNRVNGLSLAERRRVRWLGFAGLAAAIGASLMTVEVHAQARPSRVSLIQRAQIWSPTDIAARNLRLGPQGPQAFAPGETVHCRYLDKELEGNSRKFVCRIGAGDDVKVKFGGRNGEVEGEVAATRLLWAMGFAADQMYPVKVLCRGCPEDYGPDAGNGERLIDPATIERKLPWNEVVTGDRPGWSWAELDLIDERAGGAPRAQRDALKLFAVMLQHTDTKPEQQRLLCLDEDAPPSPETCQHPFVMLNDLGLTFGRANLRNANLIGSVNFEEWNQAAVWKNPTGCVGNLPKSFTGTLKDPLISEEGRRFLLRLLSQLSDRQLHDLFDVARMDLRPRSPATESTGAASVDEWVRVFKRKRAEIAARRCTEPWSVAAPLLFETGPNLWLQAHSVPALTTAMNAVSLLGFTGVYMALALMLTFAYRLRAGAALMILLSVNAVLTDAAKIVVSSPRPDSVDTRVESLATGAVASLARTFDLEESAVSVDADDGYGFPSGHVAAATAFSFGLVFFMGWRWGWLGLAVWVPLVAVSRLYLGRHFIGDVLGGVAVGIIAASVAIVGLTAARLGNRREAGLTAWRMAGAAAVLAAFALWIRLPGAYDAGRFLGVAVGTLLLVKSGVPDETSWPVSVGRIALAAMLFFATMWGTTQALSVLEWSHEPVGALLAGALPTAMMLTGPIYLPRTLMLTRYSPLLSWR
jgi:membrane-associated phospholipid phosphatase